MKCDRCGKEAEKGWRFCPNCGSSMQNNIRSLFDEIFSRFRKEFKEMDRTPNKEFEVLDISPFFRQGQPRVPAKTKRKGFTIRITRQGNQRPKVNVQTFGNVNRDAVRRGISETIGGMDGSRMFQNMPRPAPRDSGEISPEKKAEPEQEPAKYTEEPKTSIKSLGNKIVVDMELPDVKSGSDISINQLESSVEVRARAGDKAYFKIITKPGQLSVTSKVFEKGKLHLEFS